MAVFVIMLSSASAVTYHFVRQAAIERQAQARGALGEAASSQQRGQPAMPAERAGKPVEPTPAETAGAWREVKRFSDTGRKTTQQFYIKSPRWRIVWWTKTLPGQTKDNFAISVCYADGTQVATPVSIVGEGDDTSYVQTKPGRYLLDILAFNSSWQAVVEEPE